MQRSASSKMALFPYLGSNFNFLSILKRACFRGNLIVDCSSIFVSEQALGNDLEL